jgi:hypothetical protein
VSKTINPQSKHSTPGLKKYATNLDSFVSDDSSDDEEHSKSGFGKQRTKNTALTNNHHGEKSKELHHGLLMKSTFSGSLFTHIPYKLLILPPDLPLASEKNPHPRGPNGMPLVRTETKVEEFYGEIDSSN